MLTKRDQEYLDFIAQGFTDNEIAERWGIKKSSVKQYFYHCYDHAIPNVWRRKRTDLVRYARIQRITSKPP